MKYELNDRVKMAMSNETGTVIGRAEYLHQEPSYLVRYVSACGCQGEAWIGESGIDLMPATAP